MTPLPLPVPISKTTRDVYDQIEAVPEGGTIMFIMDIDPGGWGELADGAIAVATHIFSKNVKIMGVSADVNGPIFWQKVVEELIEKSGKEKNQGWKRKAERKEEKSEKRPFDSCLN